MTSLSRSCATSRLEPWTDTHTHRTTTVTLAAHARRGLMTVLLNKGTYHSTIILPFQGSRDAYTNSGMDVGRLQGQHMCGRQEQCTNRCFNPFPTTTSTHLVGIIQSWGPFLILDGLLVRVSGECPTAISSLDEGECESGVSGDPALGQRITQTLHACALRNLGEEVCSLGGCPLLW